MQIPLSIIEPYDFRIGRISNFFTAAKYFYMKGARDWILLGETIRANSYLHKCLGKVNCLPLIFFSFLNENDLKVLKKHNAEVRNFL